MQRTWLLLATVLALPPALALGQTTEELNSDGKNPENVLNSKHGSRPQELQPSCANQQIEHQAARADLEHKSDE